MTFFRLAYLLVVLATFLTMATCFMVKPSVLASASTARLATVGDSNDEDTSMPFFASEEPAPAPQQQPPASIPQQPRSNKNMDPLLASLTRTDKGANNSKTVTAPFLGEIPMDGSLVVLVPALIIGAVGFIMSVDIALHSQDAIVQALSQFSDDVTASAVSKTNSIAPLDGSCRGICSAPESDFENLKTFMESFSK